MLVQQVLYLNLVSARVRVWNGSHFEQQGEYPPDIDGIQQFGAFLDENPDRVTAVFVDIVQEEHYRDTMPHLTGSDQRNLLARKTAKTFGKTPYRTGMLQGRDAQNRENDRVIISGITRPEAVRPWMQCLLEHKTPIAGIFTPAMLSHLLLSKLDALSDATLLVTQRFDGRFRHTFYDGKHLIGSRLLRKHSGSEVEAPEQFARYLDESHQYFNPSFAPATGNQLEAVIICETSTAKELAPAAAATVNFKLRFFDINDAGRKLGVDKRLVNSDSGYLFGQLLRGWRPKANLAPPRDRRYYAMRRIKTYGRAACIALIVAGLVGAGLNAVNTFDIDRQARATSAESLRLEKTLALQQAMLPPLETDPFEMKGAVNAYNQLVSNNVSTVHLFKTISRAMDYFPRIQVDGIEWSTAQTPSADPTTAPPSPAPMSDPPVTMSLDGRVTPFDGDYTAAFAEIERFAERLAQQDGVHSVTRESMPLDIDPRTSLVGEVATTQKRDEALFSLKIIIRAGHEKV